MQIKFKSLTFTVTDDRKIGLSEYFGQKHTVTEKNVKSFAFSVFDIAGGNTTGRNVLAQSAATHALCYESHSIEENVLTIVQKSEIAEVTSVFEGYDDTNAIRITQTIKNITDKDMCLVLFHTFGFRIGDDAMKEHKDWYFHKFTNARYTESMPDVRSFYDLGMYWENGFYHLANVGNTSAREAVPQGIIENRKTSDFLMYQIESYASWYVELSASAKMFHFQIGGPNAHNHVWNKVLKPGAAYTTVPVALAHGNSVNDVLAHMTHYRRHIKTKSEVDQNLPSIYNEYMHYSWDSPYAARTIETAPHVANTGCEYYVIDCGWHNSFDCDLDGMYNHFGTWYEDRGRFPDGIKAVSDYMHSLGMKFGLWIAPEVVGRKNQKMLEYYGDECFMTRNGEKICQGTGYTLDYRNPKVRDYMTKTIDRMVKEYGCDYIKFDGCPNPGFGTEINATSLGDGLEGYIDAFTEWSLEMTKRHPNVIFEDCAGGGLRTDYKALSIFHLISTSDQTNYMHYPYIVGNIFCSVLPEQAAVWSYPIDKMMYVEGGDEGSDALCTKERIVVNMINALLGRIHLASRIHLLSEEKKALIKEGITLYNRLTPDKLKAVPYLPKGYSMFGDTFVAAGLKTEQKVYLAVWNLNGERHVKLDLPDIEVEDIKVLYPTTLPTTFDFDKSSVTMYFSEDIQARFFEITCTSQKND